MGNILPKLRRRQVMSIERAVLAGGCFWGMQDLMRKLSGVIATRVGYTGGDVPHATYRNHGSHAEAIEIEFDNDVISFRDLLAYFFQIHDPTTINRQGNDRGTSYRSAIFYVNDEQKEIALKTINDINASGLWPGKVVTEVVAVSDFGRQSLNIKTILSVYRMAILVTTLDLTGFYQNHKQLLIMMLRSHSLEYQ